MLVVVLLIAGTGAASVNSASAAAGAQFGIKDDAWILYGPGTLSSRLDQLNALGVDIVRFTLRWDEIARTPPMNGQNPRDPAYHWGPNDRVLEALNAHGIASLVTLVGTPGWANGGRGSAWAPLEGAWFGDFAYAVARRYPFVHYWTIWNEPNHAASLQPTSPAVYVKKLLNPAYAEIKRAIPTALVAGGVTAPRGNAGGVSPLAWIAGMGRAGAKLDAYAHHPYPLVPKVETPMSGGCTHCQSVTMATLDKLVKAVHRALGQKRIWLTEYGYQTSPPDPWLGVSWALQALYVSRGRPPCVDGALRRHAHQFHVQRRHRRLAERLLQRFGRRQAVAAGVHDAVRRGESLRCPHDRLGADPAAVGQPVLQDPDQARGSLGVGRPTLELEVERCVHPRRPGRSRSAAPRVVAARRRVQP